MIKKIKKCLLNYKNAVNLHPQLSHGVIGNTPVFGTDIQGSSPCGTTDKIRSSLLISRLRVFCLLFSQDIVNDL